MSQQNKENKQHSQDDFKECGLYIRKMQPEDLSQLEELFLNTRIHTYKWHDSNMFKLSDFEKYIDVGHNVKVRNLHYCK
ncbi:MAG: hypothetical protein V4591_04355 [Bdellovibrionota bacterium]